MKSQGNQSKQSTEKKEFSRKKISFFKKLGFSLIVFVLFFSLAELFFSLIEPLYTTDANTDVNLVNPYSKENVLILSKKIKSNLPESVKTNMLRNFLLHPDKDLMYRVKPNLKVHETHGYTGINSDGFRCPEFDFLDEKISYPIVLVMGDSCSFNWGIKDYQSTISYFLEKNLQKLDPTWRVCNLSQPGYSSYQALLLFRKWFSKINPEFVVFYLGWNDLWPTPLLTDKQNLGIIKMSNNPVVKAVKKSHVFKFLTFIVTIFKKSNPLDEGKIRPIRRRVPLPDALDNYREMITTATASGSSVIFILPSFSKEYLPPHAELKDYFTRAMLDYHRIVQNEFKDTAYFLNLPSMQYSDPQADQFYFDGFHPNETGSRYIADGLNHLIQQLQKSGSLSAGNPEKIMTAPLEKKTFNVNDLKTMSPQDINNLGSSSAEKGNFKEAEKLYRIAIQRDPDYALPLRNLGMMYLQLDMPDKAEKCFSDYLKNFPDGKHRMEIKNKLSFLQKNSSLNPGTVESE